VDVGPGAITKSLIGRLESLKMPETMKVIQNDTVPFWIENGRVYHKDFALGLIDLQADPMIRTEGSVGFDQTLDLTVHGQIPADKVLPEGVLRDVLSNKTLTFNISGTLENRVVKLQMPNDGSLAPAMKVLGDLLDRRQEKLRENPSRPGIFRNRRRSATDSQPQN
jgi:hypothetical protein